MFFGKTAIYLTNLKYVKILSRVLRKGFKRNAISIRAPYSKVLFASALTFGLPLYFMKRNQIECQTTDLNLDIEEKNDNFSYDDAISKAREILRRVKDEFGVPGIVVGVSIDGENVWAEGIGYADVENRVLCSTDTVMRIASISKSITMAAVAKLWEEGKLDIDKPIQEYVPYFPTKTFDGKQVVITCRQLVSHLGGIRHYDKNICLRDEKSDSKSKGDKSIKKTEKKEEFDLPEYYIKDQYKDVKSAIELFKDDPLVIKPGTKFYYSTHAWTLISAIVEAAAKEQFHVHLIKLFKKLGMKNTYLDENDVLIYHRSRNYVKDKKGKIINAPYVDNSIKWAGGGILSTVNDLIQFGNAMLYSFQLKKIAIHNKLNINISTTDNKLNDLSTKSPATHEKLCGKEFLPGYLKSETLESLWSPVADHNDSKYGMGWFVHPEMQVCKFCERKEFCVYHTGGAVGASSILLILPKEQSEKEIFTDPPRGIIVAILVNLQSVSLRDTALKIARIFDC